MSITCPKCGDENPDGTRFCVVCGEYLAWERHDAEDDTRRPQRAEPPPQEQQAEPAVGLSDSSLACAPGELVTTGTRTVLPLAMSWPLKAVVAVVVLALAAAVAFNVWRGRQEQAVLDRETYLAGSGTLTDGHTSVETSTLPDEAKIFLTPDLSQGSWAEAEPGWLPFTGAVGVTRRGWNTFSVQGLDGSNVAGMGFNYLIVGDPKGTLNGRPYEAGSGSIQPGERQVSIPAGTATSESVILLTVEVDGPPADHVAGLRVNAKEDGGFTVATLDLVPAPMEIGFSWIVVDSGDSSVAGAGTTTPGDPARIDASAASGVVLLTTDVTHSGLSGAAAPAVYVDDQDDDGFTVSAFTGPAAGFDYLIVERRP